MAAPRVDVRRGRPRCRPATRSEGGEGRRGARAAASLDGSRGRGGDARPVERRRAGRWRRPARRRGAPPAGGGRAGVLPRPDDARRSPLLGGGGSRGARVSASTSSRTSPCSAGSCWPPAADAARRARRPAPGDYDVVEVVPLHTFHCGCFWHFFEVLGAPPPPPQPASARGRRRHRRRGDGVESRFASPLCSTGNTQRGRGAADPVVSGRIPRRSLASRPRACAAGRAGRSYQRLSERRSFGRTEPRTSDRRLVTFRGRRSTRCALERSGVGRWRISRGMHRPYPVTGRSTAFVGSAPAVGVPLGSRAQRGGRSQTETCLLLSLVNGERSHSAHRSRSVMPAISAMRSSSAGQA